MPQINVRIVLPPFSLPSTDLEDRWYQRLYESRTLIYDRATTKIKDVDAFKAYLAYPAYEQFKGFVNPNFPRAVYATMKHYVKVYGGGEKWFDHFYHAMVYEGGKIFGEAVEGAKEKWFDNALPALQTNRPRYLMWGIPEIIAYGLFGQVKAKIYFDLLAKTYPDYVSGANQTTPVFEVDVYLNPAALEIKPKIIDVITQAFQFGTYAYAAGGDTMADTVIKEFTGKLIQFIKPYLLSGVTLDETNTGFEWDSTKHRPAVKILVTKS